MLEEKALMFILNELLYKTMLHIQTKLIWKKCFEFHIFWVFVHIWIGVCTGICRLVKRNIVLNLYLIFQDKGLSLGLELTDVARQDEFYRAPVFVFSSVSGFNVAFGDPSSGPHTYAASILELRHHLPSLNLMVLPSSQ